MPRAHSVLYLDQAKQEQVLRCIREHNFLNISAILDDVKALGIELSRSALGRYMKVLKAQEHMLAIPSTSTAVFVADHPTGRAVTVFNRASGRAETYRSKLSIAQIFEVLEAADRKLAATESTLTPGS